MDFWDIADAVWVGVIVVFAVLARKRKPTSGSGRKPSGNFDADKVRKLIKATGRLVKATRRRCNTDTQPFPSHGSQPNIPLPPVKRNFSAYKHLPKQLTAEKSIPDATVPLAEPKVPAFSVSASPIQRDVADKKTKLREWIIGQAVLGTPAFKKNYGNFFNR